MKALKRLSLTANPRHVVSFNFLRKLPLAPQLLFGSPKVDFIVYDYLSEVTMSLLAKAKEKDPKFGYCPDFVEYHMGQYLQQIVDKKVRIVSNAGGINPEACAQALSALVKQKGLNLNIAVVTGDDLTKKAANFRDSGFVDSDSGEPFPEKVVSVNAYLGAGAIKCALDAGADVVVTGRCVDSALALGPLMHQFSWTESDFDRLSLGSLAGHLIECGPQCTGGICTDWSDIQGWENIGFPIVEFEDGKSEFNLTKPRGTGGLLNFGSAAEQLVYEIDDPQAYRLPDVTADFSNVTIQPAGPNESVVIGGAKGRAPSDKLKVSATYLTGYRCTATCPVVGQNSHDKAKKTAQAIIDRCRRIFKTVKLDDFGRTQFSLIGAKTSYGPDRSQALTSEGVMWLAVEHSQKRALEIFAREIAAAATGMAPGLTTLLGGRPKVSPVLKLFSFYVPKQDVAAEVFVNGKHVSTYRTPSVPPSGQASAPATPRLPSNVPTQRGTHSYRLRQLAFARSGDKGDTCNIGVIARSPDLYPYLLEHLTPEVVGSYFAQCYDSPQDAKLIKRYELPGINGVNFVLPRSLGGGGVASLRFDPQGKGYAQALLDVTLDGLPELPSAKS